jgi:hypothetical protein
MEITSIESTVLPNTNGRSWYHESTTGSPQLLITAGDSWTWGDSLGKTTLEFDDYEYRTRHIYGTQLAQLLGSDLVNVGLPGRSNLNIIENVNLVLRNLKRKYDSIQVVFTLTEVGREIVDVVGLLENGSHYQDVWQGPDWPPYNQLINATASAEQLAIVKQETQGTLFGHSINLFLELRQATSLNELFCIVEQYTFQELKTCCADNNVKYIVARNFSDTFESNNNNHLVKDKWVDIIAQQGQLTYYPNPVRCLTQMSIAPMVQLCKHLDLDLKEQWIDMLESAEQAVNWLDSSPYNSKRASKHPLEQAHLWWAEHLYKQL